MKIAIFAKTHRTDFTGRLAEVIDWLRSRGCAPLVEVGVASSFRLSDVTAVKAEELPRLADAIVVFGGDGTLLSVARLIRENHCPILGVNMGFLGFLTEVTLDQLYPVLENVIGGNFKTEKRSMLQVEVRRIRGENVFYHALNDAVINKSALARVVSIDAFKNEDFIANFVADGLIVSTPTGSTAYSLSAGGPIVLPSLDLMVMTPICSHTLTNRALVLPAEDQIRLLLKTGEDVMLTIDGQQGVALEQGDVVMCTAGGFKIELVRPLDRNFFDVLRKKLRWGERAERLIDEGQLTD